MVGGGWRVLVVEARSEGAVVVAGQYCMPAEGAALSARERLLTRAELARAVRVFAALGVDKVRLTGGEPTLRADLADIIRESPHTTHLPNTGFLTFAYANANTHIEYSRIRWEFED